jgi:hypothetical protein
MKHLINYSKKENKIDRDEKNKVYKPIFEEEKESEGDSSVNGSYSSNNMRT